MKKKPTIRRLYEFLEGGLTGWLAKGTDELTPSQILELCGVGKNDRRHPLDIINDPNFETMRFTSSEAQRREAEFYAQGREKENTLLEPMVSRLNDMTGRLDLSRYTNIQPVTDWIGHPVGAGFVEPIDPAQPAGYWQHSGRTAQVIARSQDEVVEVTVPIYRFRYLHAPRT